jgi:hypothetical protein
MKLAFVPGLYFRVVPQVDVNSERPDVAADCRIELGASCSQITALEGARAAEPPFDEVTTGAIVGNNLVMLQTFRIAPG